MKFLVDENLPPSLAVMLVPLYPGTAHVRSLGIEGAKDSSLGSWPRKTDTRY
ncbi:MAG: DUF5615 family PIN-like protein [Flavobacteriales bacterium]|nr:DUF5615 family PIN-like protein [Flavobacteriales bacterium]